MGIEKRLAEASRRRGYAEEYGDWLELCSDALSAIYSLKAKLERVEGALTLAANRMDVLVLRFEYGSRDRDEASEWADAARTALSATRDKTDAGN